LGSYRNQLALPDCLFHHNRRLASLWLERKLLILFIFLRLFLIVLKRALVLLLLEVHRFWRLRFFFSYFLAVWFEVGLYIVKVTAAARVNAALAVGITAEQLRVLRVGSPLPAPGSESELKLFFFIYLDIDVLGPTLHLLGRLLFFGEELLGDE